MLRRGWDLEYHDASENPSVPEPPDLVPKPDFSHGGCGSSSLRECVELLNNTERNAPAALHSRVKKENRSDPRHAPQVWMADLDLPHFSLDPPEQCPFFVGS